MAEYKFKFEGDLSDFSPRQLECIAEVLNDKGLKQDSKVAINQVGQAGDNYVANVKRITAEKDGESFTIIAKVAPRIKQLRITMNTRELFLNEIVMYTEVLPKFTELEKAADIPADERLRYAACYGTVSEDCDELILLEDLLQSDFIMLDRFKSLTDGDIRLVLKSFARLHSLSYALKYQEPDTYNSLKDKLFDYLNNPMANEQMNIFFEMIEEDCLAMISEQKYKNCVKGTMRGMLQLGKKLMAYDANSRFSVIQQGDPWTNNIMFQLQDGKSVSCCMIDYQISRANSPVADLHYMIFNCTDHETRKQHFPEWIDYYHSELEKSLYEFGLKVNYVYPRDQLDADLKRHGKMSLSMAILLASVLCREKAAAQELKTAMENTTENNMAEMIEVTKMDEKTLSVFKARVEGAVDTCLQFGLL